MSSSGLLGGDEAGDFFKDLLESSEGTDVADAGGLFRDAEDVGGFHIGQFFKVSKDEDFAVEIAQGVEGGVDLVGEFLAHQGLAGRGHVPDQPGGHGERGSTGRSGRTGALLAGVPQECSQVSAVDVDEGLVEDHAKPDEDSTAGFLKHILQARLCIHIRLLEDILNIETSGEAGIEAEADDGPEAVAVLLEDFREGLGIALDEAVDQFRFAVIVVREFGHAAVDKKVRNYRSERRGDFVPRNLKWRETSLISIVRCAGGGVHPKGAKRP